jgi:hypothetical protein
MGRWLCCRAVLADLRPAEFGRGLARAGVHLARCRAVAGDVLEARGADERRDRRSREPAGLDGVPVGGLARLAGARLPGGRADRDDPGVLLPARSAPFGDVVANTAGMSWVPCCSSRSALGIDTVESGRDAPPLGKGPSVSARRPGCTQKMACDETPLDTLATTSTPASAGCKRCPARTTSTMRHFAQARAEAGLSGQSQPAAPLDDHP